MLQQILRDMWVDPEILAGLDEEQKQTLFCKMREEQVRKWKVWDQQVGNEKLPVKPKNNKKSVNFLKGSDDEPWVWVMGEHENDKSIEEILKEEAIEKARNIAEKETEELRKQVEAELSEYIDLTPKIEIEITSPKLKIEDDVDIYCSVDELREKMPKPIRNNNYTFNHYQNKNNKFNVIDTRDVLQEISLNTQKVAQRVALWEKRLTEERTCEIFQKIQKKRMETAREAEEAEKRQEQVWREQERKAKEAEQQIREIARKAREQHRLNSAADFETAYSDAAPGVPPGKQAVLEWYRTNEYPKKAGIDSSNNVEPWFHGLITRLEAESLLSEQPDGTFLVRLSERIWGYALSYRAPDKCKHYLVNAGKHYSFLGKNHVEHKTLGDLIAYHRQYPLSGGEKLKQSCPRNGNSALQEMLGEKL
ncbi:hypothetical protein ILUMI_12251 [Ignelater luminosus]|uniref:SH2 domain-containing protein n=1 Tax=Ignelater luminosus TaxID=2038154 RepID=A0A8K0D391_IGNLU|nr:hypothetical protein ILUMI_12251 [Ignelater luminosus]